MKDKIAEIRKKAEKCKKAFATMGYSTTADDTIKLCDALEIVMMLFDTIDKGDKYAYRAAGELAISVPLKRIHKAKAKINQILKGKNGKD